MNQEAKRPHPGDGALLPCRADPSGACPFLELLRAAALSIAAKDTSSREAASGGPPEESTGAVQKCPDAVASTAPYKLKEFAAQVGVWPSTIHEWIRDGALVEGRDFFRIRRNRRSTLRFVSADAYLRSLPGPKSCGDRPRRSGRREKSLGRPAVSSRRREVVNLEY